MAPKHHPTPLSGGDRKALRKELQKSRGVTLMLARQSEDLRVRGEAMIREADKLSCESWNERMWADGEPIDPSPTVDQAVNGGFPWLQIECSRCRTPRDIDLAALGAPATTFVHDLASRLRCEKCKRAGKRPVATLLQLAATKRNPRALAPAFFRSLPMNYRAFSVGDDGHFIASDAPITMRSRRPSRRQRCGSSPRWMRCPPPRSGSSSLRSRPRWVSPSRIDWNPAPAAMLYAQRIRSARLMGDAATP